MTKNLITITGQEGAGKSTITRELLPHTPNAARIDAEDVGQVNPFEMDDKFIKLLWSNIHDLIENFWQANYSNIIAGSFYTTYPELKQFTASLSDEVNLYVIQLKASKEVRDQRRIERIKPTKKFWRDELDQRYPEDKTLAEHANEYEYLSINTDNQTLSETVKAIKQAFPELYTSA